MATWCTACVGFCTTLKAYWAVKRSWCLKDARKFIEDNIIHTITTYTICKICGKDANLHAQIIEYNLKSFKEDLTNILAQQSNHDNILIHHYSPFEWQQLFLEWSFLPQEVLQDRLCACMYNDKYFMKYEGTHSIIFIQ